MMQVVETELVDAQMQHDIITVLRAIKTTRFFFHGMSTVPRYTDLETALRAIFWEDNPLPDGIEAVLDGLIDHVAATH